MRLSLLLPGCLLLVASMLPLTAYGQPTTQVLGIVKDAVTGKPVEFVTVYILDLQRAVETDEKGFYVIQAPADTSFVLGFTRVGYKSVTQKIDAIPSGSRKQLNVSLASNTPGVTVEVTESRIEDPGMITEEVEAFKVLPTASGNFEAILPHIALGTSSGTGGELSSQYNVRGGNYDENLVYVNDFEIYRPQLIRTGQQEGLTFPNIDLTSSLSFSSGGFEARYGDKLSSVLDVRYKRPDSTRASVSASFLGASAHLEGSKRLGKSSYNKFRYLLGARYKTTRYILGSLDIQGEYIPNFYDIQTYLTFDLSRDWQLGIIANYNRSEYSFTPATRSTATGLIDFALELFSVFEGGEVSDFTTYMGGASLTYLPERNRNPLFLKFLASGFQIEENERIDISGFYRLGQIETDLGSDDFGEVVAVLGTGTEQQFVRNYLTSNIYNIQHKGGLELQLDQGDYKVSSSHFIQWGAKYQRELIDDRINEWERIDSAGYSIVIGANEPSGQVFLNEVFKSQNDLQSNRYSGYVQNTYSWTRDSVAAWKITAGLRAQYWDLNDEFFLTPRAQLQYKPLGGKEDISFRLAGGLYFQSPFYRELRNPQGIVNPNVQAQKSFHVVGGLTHDFTAGADQRPFKFIAELYYKELWDVVSYDIDNVRIRYSGLNDAEGYIAGLDLRLNGEFVPGTESWINFSLLRARERLLGVQHQRREIGAPEAEDVRDVPRPTDQLVTISMFFQDYLPQNENFKMNLNFTWGSGLPYGLQGNNRTFRNTYRFRPYYRVDIGFGFQLWQQDWKNKQPKHPLRFTRNAWASLEVFNLLNVSNVASNTWIKTIFNNQYAIPNFLTSRRVNFRFRFDF